MSSKYPIESFYRAIIRESVPDTNVPLDMKVDKLPTLTSGLLTLSPNTANEEIVYYDSINSTNLTIHVAYRWVNPTSNDLTTGGVDYSNPSYIFTHSVNDAVRGDINNIHINSIPANITYTDLTASTITATKYNKFAVYASTAARDAAIPSPTNGLHVLVTWAGEYYYDAGSWRLQAVGTPTPNATTTVAGSVEIATQAEVNAGTATGWTGATLSVAPDTLQSALATQGPTFGNVGEIRIWSTRTAPSNWLLCNGSAVSRATYSSLFSTISPTIGTFTVTIASPAVFTLSSHWFLKDDAVYFTTTWALPTGLTANTIYYVVSSGLATNTFQVSATRGGAAINTSGTQSWTHTAVFCPYGLGNGSTTFNLPNINGKVIVGLDTAQSEFDSLGLSGGEKTHLLTGAESGTSAHSHPNNFTVYTTGGGSNQTILQNSSGLSGSTSVQWTSVAADASSPHNNLQPYVTLNYIIKY